MIRETKNYDIFNGISQLDRFKKEMKEEYLNIDDRSLPDYVRFISIYAEKINFYTKENVENPALMKNWSKFFNRDNLFLLIVINAYDLQTTKDETQELLDKVFSTSDRVIQEKLVIEIIDEILSMAEMLNYIRKHIQRSPLTTDLIFDLNHEIKTHLNVHLIELFALQSILQWDDSITQRFETLQLEWGWKPAEADEEKGEDDLSSDDLSVVRQAFHSYYYSVFHIKEASAELLENLQNDLKNNKPYVALILTFIHLFDFVKDMLNELPSKHLDHYYRDILRLQEKPATPDLTSVAVQLNPKEESFLLPKGTLFAGPKNELNEDLFFQTTSSLLLTSSKIQQMKIIYKSRDERHHQKPDQDFTTNLFAKGFERDDTNYLKLDGQAMLGDEGRLDDDNPDNLDYGRLGILVSSSMFRLASGARKVHLIFEFDEDGFCEMKKILENVSESNQEDFDETVYKVFSTAFDISISTEEGLMTIPFYACQVDFETYTWEFHFELGVDDPAFVPFTEDRDKTPTSTQPFMEILLRRESYIYLYSIVEQLRVKNIHIKTEASHLKDIELYNQLGPLDHSKPFELLGSIPKEDSHFIFGHREAFSKPITELSVNMKWAKNPIMKGGFETYFKHYTNKLLSSSVSTRPKTSQYVLSPSYLKNGSWREMILTPPTIDTFPLVKEGHSTSTNIFGDDLSISMTEDELNPEITQFENYKPYSLESTNGFVKMTLNCHEVAFGHEHYASLLSETVMFNSRLKRRQKPLQTPNAPFVPIIETVELSYKAEGSAISPGSNGENPNNIHFYQLSPFGYKEIEFKSTDHLQTFFDTDQFEGSLMLGLDKVPVNGEITLLFDMNDESTNDKYRDRAPIHWSYMRDNEWVFFDEKGMLLDTTNGFINSGIVKLKIPYPINRNTTLLDDSLFWIRGSIQQGALNLGKFDGIYENAVIVQWDGSCSSIHLEKPLPKLQITRTKDTIPEVTGIIQPNDSFMGKREENAQEYYKRISEHLRHKGRAINALDYEQLVLQRFPFIYKVKCFMANHTLSPNYKEMDNLIFPGSVHIAVIPETTIEEQVHMPLSSPKTLNSIQRYLEGLSSPFVKVVVTNPHYEEIRVNCQVQFKGYESQSYYEEKLQKEITGYLSSWLSPNELEEEFGKNVYKSDAMAYIQNLDFVYFVTEFSIVKINHYHGEDYELKDTAREAEYEEEIKVLYPWSILISAKRHNIQVIHDPAYASPKPRGIDNMELGMDFIITE